MLCPGVYDVNIADDGERCDDVLAHQLAFTRACCPPTRSGGRSDASWLYGSSGDISSGGRAHPSRGKVGKTKSQGAIRLAERMQPTHQAATQQSASKSTARLSTT